MDMNFQMRITLRSTRFSFGIALLKKKFEGLYLMQKYIEKFILLDL